VKRCQRNRLTRRIARSVCGTGGTAQSTSKYLLHCSSCEARTKCSYARSTNPSSCDGRPCPHPNPRHLTSAFLLQFNHLIARARLASLPRRLTPIVLNVIVVLAHQSGLAILSLSLPLDACSLFFFVLWKVLVVRYSRPEIEDNLRDDGAIQPSILLHSCR
jgi:hypothetical protein